MLIYRLVCTAFNTVYNMERIYNVFLQEEISQENISLGTSVEEFDSIFSNTPDESTFSAITGAVNYEELIAKIETLPEFNLIQISNIVQTQTEIRIGNKIPFYGFPFEKPLWKPVDLALQINLISKQRNEVLSPRDDLGSPDSKFSINSTISRNGNLDEIPFDLNQSIFSSVASSHVPTEINHCISCGKTFSSTVEVENHLCQPEEEKRYTCEICGKSYRTICVKIRHMHSHSNIRPHVCQICHKSFLRKEYLTSHLRMHTGDRPYSCGICSKTFAYSSAKRSHMKLHRTKPFVCSVCTRHFVSADNLKLTIGTETNQPTYTCEKCNKKPKPAVEPSHFPMEPTNLDSLEKKNIRNLKCEYCPRVYIRQSDLTKHIKTHSLSTITTTQAQWNVTNTHETDINQTEPQLEIPIIPTRIETVFACHLCSRKFNSKRLLVRHVYAHLGIKPFSCSFCSKKYSRKEDLVLHNRTHTGERPFSCDLCDKKFIRRRSYKLHRRTHTEEGLDIGTDNVVCLGEPEN